VTLEWLAGHLLAIMLASVPPNQHSGRFEAPPTRVEPESSVRARYAVLADAHARLALDPAERPVVRDDLGRSEGDGARLRTALLLLAITRHESTWVRGTEVDGKIWGDYVCVKRAVDGSCAKREPTAFCAMQIHPEQGILLEGDVWRYARAGDHLDLLASARIVTRETLDTELDTCLRVGLHMVRDSYRRTGDLSGYTGEGPRGRRATFRQDQAKNWLRERGGPP
jgi:hypothetical protein